MGVGLNAVVCLLLLTTQLCSLQTRYDNADGHENVAWKENSSVFKLYRVYFNSLTLSNANELF